MEVSYTGRLEWNHLSLTGHKKRKWGKSFVIFTFVADNPIFKSVVSFFLARPITLKGCYLIMNFERKSFCWF